MPYSRPYYQVNPTQGTFRVLRTSEIPGESLNSQSCDANYRRGKPKRLWSNTLCYPPRLTVSTKVLDTIIIINNLRGDTEN